MGMGDVYSVSSDSGTKLVYRDTGICCGTFLCTSAVYVDKKDEEFSDGRMVLSFDVSIFDYI